MAGPWDFLQNPKFKQFLSEAGQDLGYGLTQGSDFGQALGIATQRTQQMQPYRDERADDQAQATQEAEQLNQTTEWLRSRGYEDLLPLVSAGQGNLALTEALKRMQPGYGATSATADWSKLNDGTLFNQRTGEVVPVGTDGAGSTEYGLTPIWGQLPDGTFGYGVQGKDGTFRQVDTGSLSPLDPRTLAAERGFGTQIGNAQGSQAAAAQGDISNATTALDLINQIKTSPELPYATGFSAGIGGNKVPGTGRYGFQNLVDQAKSGAFLTAIQDMKGLGALSNTEGQVATAAITRMDTALSEADFLKALADYEAIISRALDRAQGRVGMQPNANTPTTRRPNTGTTSTGLSWSVSQ